ncbi:MAG: SOS response-associated peptidase [Opitutales bacterium]|nr:SOS response-associated peptidase [Opitutales bacterium]
MCGRYALFARKKALEKAFKIALLEKESIPRYNIAPGEGVCAIIEDRDRENERRMEYFQWGLIPSWAPSAEIGTKCFNAKVETAAEKPAFKESWRYRRCLLPANGWYEWKLSGGTRQPYYFHRADNELLAFAGLWAQKLFPDGTELWTCSILTTAASENVRRIHHRMPLVLNQQDYAEWLNPFLQGISLRGIQPFREVVYHSVSPQVNRSGVENANFIEQWEPSISLTSHTQTFFPGM